ncbi:DUF3237 domain-containing protein [Phenylobacterium sp.]|jgi:hypothetical protein|uniref:DUF3237 domain-containing protein n=1 Tax=Phenylobacterium sp. TaxID=1871053 RepID=UPI0037841BDE
MSNETIDEGRRLLLAGATVSAGMAAAAPAAAQGAGLSDFRVLDPVRTELVMNLVVTCSAPEKMGPQDNAPDGRRGSLWPIIGGRFEGPNIRGTVIPGGGDFPVSRPDGVVIIDALYRLKTDDGYQIIIHNKGLALGQGKYRLLPQFVVAGEKYAWLNKGVFVSTLIAGRAMPDSMRLAKGPNENDRLIQVHRIV